MKAALRAVIIAIAAWASPALAQTAPGWTHGYVPTTAQWNAIFASKQDYLGSPPLLTSGGTMTGKLVTATPSVSVAGFNLPAGTAPTSPIDGDVWTTTAGMYVQINGTTIGPLSGATSTSFAGTSPITVSFPAGVVTYAFDFTVANTFLAQQTNQGATTTSPGWYTQVAGDSVPRIRVGLNATDVPSIAFGPGNAVRDAFIERIGAGSLRFGAPDAASPIAQTFGVQNVATGTADTAGADFTINGSRGTGTGVGGSIVIQVAPAGGAGSAQNALALAVTIDSTKKVTLGDGLVATYGAFGGCTIGSNALCVTGTILFNSAITYGGVTLSNSVTGTGSMVLSAAPSIVGGSITALTTFALRDTSAAFDLTMVATSSTPLSAGRSLTLDVVNGARTVKLGANLTIATDPGGVTGAIKSNGSGTFVQAACADLSNGATGCSTATGTSGATIPLLNGTNTWSGAQSFNDGDLILKGSSSGTLTMHAAATAGSSVLTWPAGTTDFSATGGASQFLKQASAGAAITVARPACADLSDATYCSVSLTNGITNANLAQAAAYTFKGNATGSTANVTDFTIASLTHKASPTGADLLIVANVASANQTSYATIAEALAGVSAGVVTLNSVSGAVTWSMTTQTFTSDTTYTPTAGTVFSLWSCVGAGGSGGGAASTANRGAGAGGGGAGSRSWIRVSAATIGASKLVKIGAGGAAPTAGANAGNAGGDACFTTSTCTSGQIVAGKGGSGGSAAAATAGGSGGLGGVVGTGISGNGPSGGHGFGWDLSISGAALFGSMPVWGGAGGDSVEGGGGRSVVGYSSADGEAGTLYGGGGAGGRSYNGAGGTGAGDVTGGAGAEGRCVAIDYTIN